MLLFSPLVDDGTTLPPGSDESQPAGDVVVLSDGSLPQTGSVQQPAMTAEMLQYLKKRSLAFYASENLTGPNKAPYHGKFLIAEHHEEWADLCNSHERLCLLAARDHGKCALEGHLILRTDGTRIPIEEWEGGEVLAWNAETCAFDSREASPRFDNGKKSALLVRTRTGREVRVTENHPLLHFDGWLPAERLRVGMRIAVPRKIPVEGTEPVESPWLLGLLIGDGCLLAASTPSVTTGDPAVVAEIEHEAARRGWRVVPRPDRPTYMLSTRRGQRQGTAKAWIHALGAAGGSADKHVPGAIFVAPNTDVAAFLAGYLDADGSVNLKAGGAVEYYSVSEDLLRGVQHLLLRLGVISVLSVKRGRYKGAEHLSWRLTIRGADVLSFAKHVHPVGAKRQQLMELVRLQEAKGPTSGPAIDRFPAKVPNLLGYGYVEDRQPTRAKVRQMAQSSRHPDAQALLRLADSDVLWDEIVEIEDLGEQQTWGIEVEGLENYLADDVVNHNSHMFTLAYPLWMAEKYPGEYGYIFSASQPQAEKILLKLIDEVEKNPNLAHLRPSAGGKSKKWSAQCVQFANGFTIYARGYGTKVRGAHPIFIVVDDGLNDETVYSERIRTKDIDYFAAAITNMIVPGGQIVVIGTPMHKSDLYGQLLENTEYHSARYPAIYPKGHPKAGQPLWPDRYSLPMLEARKREIGSIKFAREFLCEIKNDDTSLFPRGLFQGDEVERRNVRLGMPLSFWKQAGIRDVFMGVDFGLAATRDADYTVIWTVGLDPLGNRWILDIQREQGLAYGAQKSLINKVARYYQPGLIFVESNQAQRIFGEELARETDLPIHLFQTGAGVNSLTDGIPGIRVMLENSKYRIPRGDEHSVKLTDIWMDEMSDMTLHNGRIMSVGDHDDTVSACYLTERAIAKGSFSFTFEEEEGDREVYDEMIRLTDLGPEEDPEFLYEDDFILGAEPQGRGRPQVKNAQLVESRDVASTLAEPDVVSRERRKKQAPGQPFTLTEGLKPMRDVLPKLGAPSPFAVRRFRGG